MPEINMLNPLVAKLYFKYKTDDPKGVLRFGQYFCNIYIKKPWPELFYEVNDDKARVMIAGYLDALHYTEQLPSELRSLG